MNSLNYKEIDNNLKQLFICELNHLIYKRLNLLYYWISKNYFRKRRFYALYFWRALLAVQCLLMFLISHLSLVNRLLENAYSWSLKDTNSTSWISICKTSIAERRDCETSEVPRIFSWLFWWYGSVWIFLQLTNLSLNVG